MKDYLTRNIHKNLFLKMCKINLKSDDDEEVANTLPLIQETPQILNPFSHKLVLDSPYERLKVAVMSIFVLPFRIIGIILCLAIAYILSIIGLKGLSREQLGAKPMTGYRAMLKTQIVMFFRFAFSCFGFHYVRVKGRQAPSKEAPVLVGAPHSSFFDTLPVLMMGGPTVVAKKEVQALPVFSKYIDYTQPIYVYREDPNSRHKTIQEIKRRAWSDEDWSQIMIFPEGTCTNRSCLVSFKPGAFIPGVPIQPIVLRYPNKLDSFTWTWDGSNALKNIWVTLCQFHNYCEIEYLPVYKPSPEEIKDPILYARNVRQVMADALGVPVVDYSFDDCKLMGKAKKLKLPLEAGLIEFQTLKQKYGFDLEFVGMLLKNFAKMASKDGKVTLKSLARYLKMPVNEPAIIELFNLYDTNGYGYFNFRDYVIGFCEHIEPSNKEETLSSAFRLFDADCKGSVSLDDLSRCLKTALDLTPHESLEFFEEADTRSKGKLEFDDFASFVSRKPEYAKIFSIYQGSVKNSSQDSFRQMKNGMKR